MTVHAAGLHACYPCVCKAFDALRGKHSDVNDPVRPSLLNGAARLRTKFKQLLGTDLTVADPLNRFWHTGVPTNAEVGDQETKRFDRFMWRVSAGTSSGKGPPSGGRRKAESHERFIERWLKKHMHHAAK